MQRNKVRQSKSKALTGLIQLLNAQYYGGACQVTQLSVVGEVREQHYVVKGSETKYTCGPSFLS